MRLLDQETRKYEDIWCVDGYDRFSPGESYVSTFLDMIGTPTRGSVLDAGSGSGKGAIALAREGFSVTCCDLTPAGLAPEARGFPFVTMPLWADLRRRIGLVDWVYCTDVLEHVPTELTLLTIMRLIDVARHGVFLSIALVPDQFGVFVGEPLHHTVQPFTWWRDRMRLLGTLQECRDAISHGFYLVTP